MSESWSRAGMTNDQACHQLSGPESLITEWEEPVIYILQPSMEGTGPGHPSLLLWMLLQLGILLSVWVNYFCWAIQRLQDCDTHWALCITYISCCASLFAEATNTCINAVSIFKLLFLLLLQDNVFSLSKGEKNTNLNKKVFQKQVMYRHFFCQTLISVFKAGTCSPNGNREMFPRYKRITQRRTD